MLLFSSIWRDCMAIAARINEKRGLVEGNLSGTVWRSKPGKGKESADMYRVRTGWPGS